MKNSSIGLIVVVLLGLGLALKALSALNQEAALRAEIVAKQRNVETSFDTMKKIITQKAQLPEAAKKDLLELLPEVVAGRSGGSVFKSVQERYPEFTMPLYLDLSRSIEAERHTFQTKQESLSDTVREYDALRDSAIAGFVLQSFGRKRPEVTMVSSTAAKEAVRTGKDDDVELFKKEK